MDAPTQRLMKLLIKTVWREISLADICPDILKDLVNELGPVKSSLNRENIGVTSQILNADCEYLRFKMRPFSLPKTVKANFQGGLICGF